MIQLNVTPVDPNGNPIAKPIITVGIYDATGKPQPMEPAIREQTNFYSSDAPYNPSEGAYGVYGVVQASGYQTAYFGPQTWDGKETLTLSPVLQPGF